MSKPKCLAGALMVAAGWVLIIQLVWWLGGFQNASDLVRDLHVYALIGVPGFFGMSAYIDGRRWNHGRRHRR